MTIAEALTQAVAGGYHIHGSDGIATDFVGANVSFRQTCLTLLCNVDKDSC
jgi:hypothetical protein